MYNKNQVIYAIEHCNLNDKQKLIISSRYGINTQSVSMDELFSKFNITYDDFKQIEKQVRQFLKEHYKTE
ncbi:hypothetical protein E4K67_15520 [Desulfosporosinus fructosivorans]|uniref:RNA polymerase sigma-70 region 4 domain-containing protein n=1 Tax=Desulfosporosinus fructosivorans TaxID=2018669 RepID=A0A4Z0R525_9FIRM|nr:hypothetical protein [Desulfosporosinus fructosivorans]TGE37263.1 hypothetical protein E4K67_15520 [Desulfosporosinus fructosivorans]